MMLPVPNAPAGPHTVARRWTRDPENVGRARDELCLHLAKWNMAEVTDSALLVLSELVTNAVRHAQQPGDRLIETRFVRRDGGVRIEVHDAGDDKPELREGVPWDQESGRGLVLVDHLTGGRWGVSDREGVGKTVWAHIACGSGGADAAEVDR